MNKSPPSRRHVWHKKLAENVLHYRAKSIKIPKCTNGCKYNAYFIEVRDSNEKNGGRLRRRGGNQGDAVICNITPKFPRRAKKIAKELYQNKIFDKKAQIITKVPSKLPIANYDMQNAGYYREM
jgi:hypothetical protein